MAAVSSDSANTRKTTAPSPKPSALSTPCSEVRSATARAMVFPVTRTSVKKTTPPTTRTSNCTSPICFTNDRAKAFSVCVRVSQVEFAKAPSIARLTAAAWEGSARVIVYQPTMPRAHSGPFSWK
jgi:hypothetical protein